MTLISGISPSKKAVAIAVNERGFLKIEPSTNSTQTGNEATLLELRDRLDAIVGILASSLALDGGWKVEATNNFSSANSYSQLIGDGISTSFVITHNLNSPDAIAAVREANTPGFAAYPTLSYESANVVRVVFASPPNIDEYRVIVKA